MKKTTNLVCVLIICLLLTGCSAKRTLYSGETLKIERQGQKIIVQELVSGQMHILQTVRVRKSEQAETPKTLICTSTITITSQGSITTVKTVDGALITITRRRR